MIVLAGADLVLPDRIQREGTLVIEGDRIVDVLASASAAAPLRRDKPAFAPSATAGRPVTPIDLRGHVIVPGFIDVHIHGVEGTDVLDSGEAIAIIAGRLPKYGVTAFCPTTVACGPDALRDVLRIVGDLRARHEISGARVLPAHLESNFINPDYNGAQPLACLRLPPRMGVKSPQPVVRAASGANGFDGADILAEIDRAEANVGIVTLAPELDGALDLIRHLVDRGRRVSLGHSGATRDQSLAAIDAGARHATHLFNRMPPLNHRDPGLAGAVLASDEIAAEIICDGVHVHRDMVRMTVSAKGADRVMAITDAVAAAGLPDDATARLGGRVVRVRQSAAYLEDGTLAGSVATMDAVFRFLVGEVELSLNAAAELCATTPARQLGLEHSGSIRKGAIADVVVLDRNLNVRQTYVGGTLAYESDGKITG